MTRVRSRAVMLAVAAVVAMAGVACSAPPGPINLPGGTYTLDLELPAQTVDYSALGCTATLTLDSISLPGATVTVPSIVVNPGDEVVSVDDVTVTIPAGSIPGGSAALTCFGIPAGSISFSVTFDGTASSGGAVYDVAAEELTLTDTTIDLNNAVVSVGGLTLPLPTPTVTIPSISVPLSL